MQKDSLKQKLKDKELTIGSWITMADSCVIDIMSDSGFDWLVIDMEHSSITYESALNVMSIMQPKGIDVLVRVPKNEEVCIKKAMDAGADGVVVPMVKTPDDAKKAVSYVKYPPDGVRGVGLYRAQGYGHKFEEYKNWVKTDSVVIVQIEHIDAVNNLSDILKIEGVDGIIVGPYDLSASLSKAGEFNSKEVKNALSQIVNTTKNASKSLGFHVVQPCADQVDEKIKEGYNFIAFSLDFLFLKDKIKQEMDKIKGMKK